MTPGRTGQGLCVGDVCGEDGRGRSGASVMGVMGGLWRCKCVFLSYVGVV